MTRTPVRAALPALLSAALTAVAMAASSGVLAAPKSRDNDGDRYTMADFAKVQKIDSHVHLHNADPAFIDAARQLGFKVLTINVDYPDFPRWTSSSRRRSSCARRVRRTWPGR
ncbi:hypothetical protein [Roseateles chitinivorans]|uniref:hypothetical protein n=1 Tax=Roseateles chitinivorans TaxID=2917965 RepID=UPI003D6679C1